jgi:hypothetical protein
MLRIRTLMYLAIRCRRVRKATLVHERDIDSSIGLGGGIVKMPKGCDPEQQQMGRGFTNYYCVSSLEEVRRSYIVA